MRNGWKLQSNEEKLYYIKIGLKAKDGFCPSIGGMKTPELKCPCKAFREEEICMCELYVKNEVEEK